MNSTRGQLGYGSGNRRVVRAVCTGGLAVVMLLAWSAAARAEEPGKRIGPDPKVWRETVEKGIQYLRSHGQAEDGSFSSFAGTGVTSLVATALMRSGLSPEDPAVAKALKCILGSVQPDGGIYQKGSFARNYETCVAIFALTEANKDGRYNEVIKRAEGFLKGLQWDENDGKQKSDVDYGGGGYGKHKRPDLSNTSFLVDALKACGAGPDDPAMQKALIFVSRCQNFESEHNTTPFATKNPDGGFYYTVAAGGESPAGETPNGGLRSYGSMTYAGLKSMIYAGVGPDDPRVKAALEWIRKHYGLETNPGMGPQGLYYYYHTFAKALDAVGKDLIEDGQGVKHDWRAELTQELAKRQQPNGSWINEGSSRWLEGDPNLTTAYVLLALDYCRPQKGE